MFVVVRNTKSAQNNLDYKLGRGDIIKLGRIKFNVKDYRTKHCQSSHKKCCPHDEHDARSPENPEESKDNQVNDAQLAHNNSMDSLREEFEEEAVEIDCGVVDPKTSPDIQCKICWDNSSTPENPLLNSCNCDGSVRYIHYECLKYWLKQKMAKKEEKNLISYTWK